LIFWFFDFLILYSVCILWLIFFQYRYTYCSTWMSGHCYW
jgi:hypothetical protein